MSPAISIKNLHKRYNEKEIFRGFNLEVKPGKITALFGPNGSGKSTLFNILTGVTELDAGEYLVPNISERQFSYISQNYSETLFPWQNIRQNLSFPLEIRNVSEGKIQQKTTQLIQQVDLHVNLQRYPYELSGGQQQIVAFLRALITDPKLLLLDEPFSALDYENNLRLRIELQQYYLSTSVTIFIITHDIEEAVSLASEIVVFSPTPTQIVGKVENSLPYPRTIEVLKTEAFHQIKNQVLELFQSVVRL